ncbi:DoxX family protein [Streptomyces klenkii]|uniref:DoxX family protein n=1 Tax=Streptomyces klenkii TaxID=1420899 RepID=UPI00341DDD0C
MPEILRIASRIVRLDVPKQYTITGLRISIGVIFLWFGIPKFFPGGSPAEPLAVRTVDALSLGVVEGDCARILVASAEIVIALMLLSGAANRLTAVLLIGHLVGACAPLLLFPSDVWRSFGVGTMEGQYMIKNVILVAAALVIAGHSGQNKSAESQSRRTCLCDG